MAEGTVKYQKHMISNLLQKEIGREYRKYTSFQDTYRHHHQLLYSVKPDSLIPIDFNKFEPENAEYKMNEISECLGFSPNGKYLAFHSHQNTSISILSYSGIQGAKTSGDTVYPEDVFGKLAKVDLTNWSEYFYDFEPVSGSWWTDDSSTVIILITMEVSYEVEEEAQEEDSLDRANEMVTETLPEIRIGEIILTRQDRNQPLNPIREEREAVPAPIRPQQVPNVIQENRNTRRRSFEQKINRFQNVRRMEKGETSRTVPQNVAIASSLNEPREEYQTKKEATRAMPVEHALARDFISDDEIEEEDPNVPSTSSGRKRSPEPSTSNPTEEKRVKMSMADQLRAAVQDRNTARVPPMRSDPRKHILNSIEKFPELIKEFKSSNVNKFAYANRLRRMVRRETAPSRSPSKLAKLDKEEGRTIVFIAYNIEEKTVSNLVFEDVRRKFHCHMRDRKLVVAFNEDTVETYELSKENTWEHDKELPLSTRQSIDVLMTCRAGNMPGMTSQFKGEVRWGKVFEDLYESESFFTPIQHDVAVLLNKDMKDWVQSENSLLDTDYSEISRCHWITDDLIAITMFYENKNVKVGVIVSEKDSSVTLYPDYHKFLKQLFLHHLPDMVPRHWTYLNPIPVTQQQWFKHGFIDLGESEELENFERLNDIYGFLSTNWGNMKSTSNPLTDPLFNSVDANCFMGKYIFANGEELSLLQKTAAFKEIHMEQWFHPVDPFILINNVSNWMLAFKGKDPDDVVVN